jgi:fibronectin-binding autotransporter adhesin
MSNHNYARYIEAGTRLKAPQFSATSTQAILGSSTAIGVVVTAATGIVAESQTQDLTVQSSLGGDVTVASISADGGNVVLNAGGSAIRIGTSASDDVTLGNSTSGTVAVKGVVTLGSGASDSVTVGGSGSTTTTMGAANGDSVVVGASGATFRADTHLTTASGVDIGTSSSRFGTVFSSNMNCVNLTATNMTFSNQTLAWSTTLLQDESAVNLFIGSPVACKMLSCNVSTMVTGGYYATNGTARYYPLQWDDPRSSDSASEKIGLMSGNVQIMNIQMTHVAEFVGNTGSETWNLVFAPKTTALKSAMSVETTVPSNNSLQLQVADNSGLTVGDALVLSGFSNTAWNARTIITGLSGSTLVTTGLSHTGAADDEENAGTATVQSQLAAWSTDVQGSGAVAIAASDMTLSETGFDSAAAGACVTFGSGPFPVHSLTDTANDTYFALRLTTAGTHPSAGTVRAYVLAVSAGAVAS